MTGLHLFLAGITFGLAASAPVGPVNIMVIQRVARCGFRTGFVASLGATLADVVYATIAAFGLTVVSDFITGHETTLQLVGGLVLVLFGALIFRTRPFAAPMEGRPPRHPGMLAGFGACFACTILNPASAIGFLALMGGLGDTGDASLHPEHGPLPVLAGVLVGALLWWTTLSGLVALNRDRLTPKRMSWINRGAGVALMLLGAAALVRVGLSAP
ncbi:LysE family translocator [Segnochrobactraceae bacterium EtOH-i3]